jgi:hypothetical protein
MKLKKEFVSFFLLTFSCSLIRSSGFELSRNERDSANKSDLDNSKNSVIEDDLIVLQNEEKKASSQIVLDSKTGEPCLGMNIFFNALIVECNVYQVFWTRVTWIKLFIVYGGLVLGSSQFLLKLMLKSEMA